MAEIASRAGMTRGAIQHHFEGRETLVLAILETLENRIVCVFDQVADDRDSSVEAKIDTMVEALGEVAQSDAYLAVLDIWVATRADQALARPVRASVARATRHYRALWGRLFRGKFPAEVYENTLRIVVAMLRGLVVSRMFEIAPRSIELTITVCKDAVKHYVAAALDQGLTEPRQRRKSAPPAT